MRLVALRPPRASLQACSRARNASTAALGGCQWSREQECALALIHHLDTVTVTELRRPPAVDTTVAQEAPFQGWASSDARGGWGRSR